MKLQGAIVGALGLCVLEFVLTSDPAVARLGNVSTGIGAVLTRLIDPSVPLFGSATPPPKTPATPPATPPKTTTS
jgi:hypothetical protein